MEEENPTQEAKEVDPPNKVEVASATTTKVARVIPVENENLALVAEEVPKKVEAMTTEGEGKEEEHKKIMVDGQEEEDMGSKGKGEGFGGLGAENYEGQCKGREDDGGDEANAKGGSLGVGDTKVVIDAVEVVRALETKLENTSLASIDVVEGVDKGKLQEVQEEVEVGSAVEAKVVNKLVEDWKSKVVEEKKLEPEGDQEEVVGYKGEDGGELGEEKDIGHSAVSVEAVEDMESPFAKANDELLGYEKEIKNDTIVREGKETLKESTKKDGVEDEVAKPEPMSKVVHDVSVKEVDPTSEDNVLKYCIAMEQEIEDQAIASEAMEVVGVEKPSEFANIDARVEDIGVDDPREIENVASLVEVIDVEKPTEVENVAACSGDNILSQELLLESSNENNDSEKDEGAKNDDAKGYIGMGDDNKVEKVEEDVKGMRVSVANTVKLENNELGKNGASMAFHDASKGEDKGELCDEQEGKVGVMIQANVADKYIDDAKVAAIVKDEKLKQQGEKGEEVGYGGRDSGELGKENKAKVSIVSVETAELEDKVAIFVEPNSELSYEKEEMNDIIVMRSGKAPKKSIEVDVSVEVKVSWKEQDAKEPASTSEVVEEFDIDKPLEVENIAATIEDIGDVKLEPTSKESIEIEHDGSIKEVDPSSGDSVLKDSPWTEQNVEVVVTTSEVVEDVGIDKSLEVENVDTIVEDIGMEKPLEIEKIVDVKGVDVKPEPTTEIVHEGSVKEVDASSGDSLLKDISWKELDAEESASISEVVEEFDVEKPLEVENIAATIEDVGDMKPEPTSKENIVIEHDGSIKEVDPSSGDSVLKDSPWTEHNVKSMVTTSEVVEDVGIDKALEVEHVDTIVEDITMEKPLEIEKIVNVKGIDIQLEPTSETSIVIVHDGSVKEVDAASGDSLLKDSSWKEQVGEEQASTSEVVEEFDVEKPLEVENIATTVQDVGDVKPEPLSKENIVIEHDGSIKEVNPSSEDSVLKDSPWTEQNVEAVVATSEVVEHVGVEQPLKVENVDTIVEDIGMDKPLEIEKNVDVKGVDVKHEPTSEASIVVVHDESVKEVDVASGDSLLKDISWKEQDVEEPANTSEVLEEFDIEKPLEVENIAAAVKYVNDVKLEPPSKENIVIEHDESIKEVDPSSGDSVLEDCLCTEQNVEGMVTTSEVAEVVGFEKSLWVENIATIVEDIGLEKPLEIENFVYVKCVDVKPEPTSEASIVIVHEESVKEVDAASGDTLLKNISWKKQDAEELASTSEVVEVFDVEKPLEVEYIAATVEDIGDVKFEPPSKENIVIEHDGSIKDVDPSSEDSMLKDSPWTEWNVEAVVTTSEVVEHVGVKQPLNVENVDTIDTIVEDIGMEKPLEIEKIVDVKGVDVKPKPTSEIEHEGSIKEVDGASGDSVLKDISWKEQDAEEPANTSEVVEEFDVEKPLEVENIAATVQDIGDVKLEPPSKENIVIEHDGSIKEVDPSSGDSVFKDSPLTEQNVESMVTTSEVVEDVGIDKPLEAENVDTIIEDIGMEKPLEIEKIVDVKGVNIKPEPTSEASIVIVHEGSVTGVDAASGDSLLKDVSWKEKDAEVLASTSEVVEEFDVEKPLEVENIAATVEDVGDVKPEPTSKESTLIEHDGSIKEVDPSSGDSVFKDSPWTEHNIESIVTTSEVVEDVGVDKPLEVENVDTILEDTGMEKPLEIEKIVDVKGIDVETEPTSEASIVIVHEGSVKEVNAASGDNKLEDISWKEQDAEEPANTSEVLEEFDVEKPLEVENVAATIEDVGDVKPEPPSKENIVIEHDESIEEVDPSSGDSVLKDIPWTEQNIKGMVTTSKVVEDVGFEKSLEVENIATIVEDISMEKPLEIEKFVDIKRVDVKPEPTSEASIVIVHEESVKEVDAASGDSLLKNISWKEQDAEEPASTSEVVEDVGVEKPLDVENIATIIADIGIKKPLDIEKIVDVKGVDVKPEPTSDASIVIVNDGSINEVNVASVDYMLKDSAWKEQVVEGLASPSEVVEDFGVEMPLEVENIVETVEDVGDMKLKPTSKESIVIVHDRSIKELDPSRGDSVFRDSPWTEQNVEGMITASEVVEDVGVEKPLEVENIATTVEDTDMEKPLEIGKFVDVEGVDVKLKPTIEKSIVIMHDGSVKEVDVASGDILFKDSSWKEQDAEEPASTSEVVEQFDVEKPLEVENIAATVEDIGAVKPEPTSKKSTVIVHDGSIKEVDPSSGDSMLKDNPWTEQNVEGMVTTSEVVEDVGVGKPLDVESSASIIKNIGMEKPLEIEKCVDVKGIDVKPEPTSEASIVIVHDGSVKEINVASGDILLKDSSWKEQDTEEPASTSEVLEEFNVEKPLEVDNIVATVEDVGDMKPEPTSKESIVNVLDGSIKKVDPSSGDNVLKDNPCTEQNVEGLANASEAMKDIGVEKPLEVENIVDVVEDIGVMKPTYIENVVPVEGAEVMPKSMSEASIVVVHDGSVKEFDPTSVDCVLKDSHGKEQNVKGLATTSEMMEDVDVDMVLEIKNIDAAVEDIGLEKTIDIQNVAAVEVVDVEKPMNVEIVVSSNGDGILSRDQFALESNKENNYAEETECATDIVDHEEEDDGDGLIEVVIDEDCVGIDIEANEDVGGVTSNTSSAWVPTFKSDDATKQTMKELVEGSSSGNMLGLIDFTKSMGDGGDDNEDERSDYASLTPTGGPSCENIIFSPLDGSGIINMDRATGLGSSPPPLRPSASHQPAESNLFSTSELALTAYPTEEMTEEEKKLHDKVELIRINYLRLVYRLGATFGETVAAQVLYRLSLAEGINHGRQSTQAFSLDYAWKKALILEAEGKEDINFSCNILVLGKTGVGKSATINSVFGEEKLKTDAFSSTTTSMQEIVGYVHGVKIRIIDTPGLRPSVMDQGTNRKILAAVKKYTKKCPPDIVLYVDRLDCLSRECSDLPLLKTITAILGPSIWLDAIVALTHAASAPAPPEGLDGTPITYDVIMAQSSHIIQQSIRQAAGDMCLMNPVAFVENHPSCMRNSEGQKVLPNGENWRRQMLLLCYSSKILSEANSLLKLHDPNHENLSGFPFGSLNLNALVCSLLQSRAHPELSVELDDYSDEEEYDQLPPSFDCDNPTYRYRIPQQTSTVLARPVIDTHGWDHDCGYDGISVDEALAILDRFPANVAVYVTKNKKEFSIHLDSSIAAKHGENASSLAGFDIHTAGQQLVYVLRGETQIKNIKKNMTTGGFLVTFLGDDIVAAGLKVEDQLSLGERLLLVATTGAMRGAQGDTAYGANLEARLKDRDCTLGLSLMKWCQELALGASLQSQFSIGRGSKMALHLGLNNKLSGRITVKTSTSEQLQIALLGLVPVAASIYRSFFRASEQS